MDTLAYFDKLVEGGTPPEQARTQAHTLNDALSNVATKDDLKIVREDTKTIKWSLLIGILLLLIKIAFHW